MQLRKSTHVVVVAGASRVLYWPVHCLTPEFLILYERLLREYMTVVRVFFKTKVLEIAKNLW